MKLKSTPKFERAYRKFVRRQPHLQTKIDDALHQMTIDLTALSLRAHKLSGKLAGLRACSCGYDCRIVFSIQQEESTGEEIILLVDIGTHEEVY